VREFNGSAACKLQASAAMLARAALAVPRRRAADDPPGPRNLCKRDGGCKSRSRPVAGQRPLDDIAFWRAVSAQVR
jgi:hypothetical protein